MRSKIRKTAYNLIADIGYDKTSVNMIVRKAKISKGGFYHHYDSKEDLLVNIIEEMVNEVLHKKVGDLSQLARHNYEKALVSIGLNIIDASKEDPRRKKFSVNVIPVLCRDNRLFKKMFGFMYMGVDRLAEIIKKGMELGLLSKKTKVKLTAQKMFMELDVLEMYSAFDVPFPIEAIWRDYIKSLLGGKQ